MEFCIICFHLNFLYDTAKSLCSKNLFFRYNWTCYPLRTPVHDCFESRDQVPVMNETLLIFPASWLNSNFKQFRFNLTVFRIDDQGIPVENATSDQVIEWESVHTTIE